MHLDIHQQVTDTIIRQLEAGTIPWQQPWKGDNNRMLNLPKNLVSGKHYRGINIVLLWSAAIEKEYTSSEWASFKQWNAKSETIRKGEKGSLIVYYDTFEKEVDGELKKIPFLKSSVVFNRCQAIHRKKLQQKKTQYPLWSVLKPLTALLPIPKRSLNIKTTELAMYRHRIKSICHIPKLLWIRQPAPLPKATIRP